MNLQERIDAARQKNMNKRRSKASSLAINFTLQNLNALWVELMLEHFPECKTPGRFNTKLFIGPLRAGLKSQGLGDDPQKAIDFLKYAVANWSYLYELCGWNKLDLFGPEPSPSAIARGVKIILEAQNRHEAVTRHNSANTVAARLEARRDRENTQPRRHLRVVQSNDDSDDDEHFFARRFNQQFNAAV